MKKSHISTAPDDSLDEAPPLPKKFGRRGIVRKFFQPLSAGAAAPVVFKDLVRRARGEIKSVSVRNTKDARRA